MVHTCTHYGMTLTMVSSARLSRGHWLRLDCRQVLACALPIVRRTNAGYRQMRDAELNVLNNCMLYYILGRISGSIWQMHFIYSVEPFPDNLIKKHCLKWFFSFSYVFLFCYKRDSGTH